MSSLASGASNGPVTTTITLPTNLSGTYFLIACADYSDAVVETTFSNNCTAVAMQVAGADLAESSFSVLTTAPVSGGSVSVSDTATDQGLGIIGSSNSGVLSVHHHEPDCRYLAKDPYGEQPGVRGEQRASDDDHHLADYPWNLLYDRVRRPQRYYCRNNLQQQLHRIGAHAGALRMGSGRNSFRLRFSAIKFAWQQTVAKRT